MFYNRPCGLLGKDGGKGKTKQNKRDVFHVAV